jgi:tetratricopeptide (TPR) repeat protein
MTAQALPKTNELMDKVNSFIEEYRLPTEFEIRLLKKETDNLKNVDYCDYYQLLGMIASLENKKKDIVSNFENAIKLNPNDFVLQYNYATILRNKGLLKLSIEQAQQSLKKYPQNTEALECLFTSLNSSCRLNEAMELFKKVDDKSIFNFNDMDNFIESFKIFNQAGLSDDEARNIQELSFKLVEEKNIYVFEHVTEILNGSVSRTIYVDVPIEDIFDLNWELAGKLANLEDSYSDVLSFKYSSVDVLRECREYERNL